MLLFINLTNGHLLMKTHYDLYIFIIIMLIIILLF